MVRHDKVSFPKRVDFINGPGHMDGHDSRTKRGLPEGGPRWVLSPFGVFDFEPKSKAMRLMSINEGVTVEEIRDNTAFDLIIPANVMTSKSPSPAELALLRNKVDTGGVLNRKFPWPKKVEA